MGSRTDITYVATLPFFKTYTMFSRYWIELSLVLCCSVVYFMYVSTVLEVILELVHICSTLNCCETILYIYDSKGELMCF